MIKYFAILLLISISVSFSQEIEPKGVEDVKVVIRFKNGDILTGFITRYIQDEENGEGFKFKTSLGTTTIYNKEIVEIREFYSNYRHSHRVFLMPTAEPIENNHFIGNFELGFFYAGIGITKYFSLTAGRSIIPGISNKHQISTLNTKVTFLQIPWQNYPGKLSIAAGGNIAFINHNNRIENYYAVSTLHFDRTRFTTTVFTKNGPRDFYELRFQNNLYDMIYENGAFGIGLGLDTKISKWHDIRFIGEIWNNNVLKRSNSGVLLGVRLANTELSSDFGIAFFTQPFLVPFLSFTWTPF